MGRSRTRACRCDSTTWMGRRFSKHKSRGPEMTHISFLRALCIAVFLSGLALAQVTTATFYGVVQDSSGAMVPATKATLINQETGATRVQITDSKGEFGFQFVPVGTYTLRLEAQGFQTWKGPATNSVPLSKC